MTVNPVLPFSNHAEYAAFNRNFSARRHFIGAVDRFEITFGSTRSASRKTAHQNIATAIKAAHQQGKTIFVATDLDGTQSPFVTNPLDVYIPRDNYAAMTSLAALQAEPTKPAEQRIPVGILTARWDRTVHEVMIARDEKGQPLPGIQDQNFLLGSNYGGKVADTLTGVIHHDVVSHHEPLMRSVTDALLATGAFYPIEEENLQTPGDLEKKGKIEVNGPIIVLHTNRMTNQFVIQSRKSNFKEIVTAFLQQQGRTVYEIPGQSKDPETFCFQEGENSYEIKPNIDKDEGLDQLITTVLAMNPGLKREDLFVIFVGDGKGDGPALRKANLGIYLAPPEDNPGIEYNLEPGHQIIRIPTDESPGDMIAGPERTEMSRINTDGGKRVFETVRDILSKPSST